MARTKARCLSDGSAFIAGPSCASTGSSGAGSRRFPRGCLERLVIATSALIQGTYRPGSEPRRSCPTCLARGAAAVAVTTSDDVLRRSLASCRGRERALQGLGPPLLCLTRWGDRCERRCCCHALRFLFGRKLV